MDTDIPGRYHPVLIDELPAKINIDRESNTVPFAAMAGPSNLGEYVALDDYMRLRGRLKRERGISGKADIIMLLCALIFSSIWLATSNDLPIFVHVIFSVAGLIMALFVVIGMFINKQ